MSGCEEYRELISCLLDGELNEEESSALAEHLEHCGECRTMYEAFTGISKSISENMVEVPEELHENIMAAVCRESIKNKNSRKKLSKPLKAILTTAACAVIVVGAGAAVLPGFFRCGSSAPENYAMAARDTAEGQSEECTPEEVQLPPEMLRKNVREVPDEAPAEFDLKESSGDDTIYSQSAPQAASGDQSTYVVELGFENWERMETFLHERESKAEIALPDAPDYIITVTKNSSNLCLNAYFIDDILYYQSEEGQVYNAACSAEEFADFLDSLE